MEMLVVIKARDPEGLSRFYAALGLHFECERHGNGPEHYASRVGASVFEIYPRASDTDSTSSTRIGFGVADLDAACTNVLIGRGRMVRAAADTPWGRRAVVTDPEGHTVEIVETEKPMASPS
ncbi:VOC family protein [Zavarzinia sp.]|uniref:VOC family protein n=1 Tax=Zavarzinia sp. TaxID=2027920 RepID=UPI003BB5E87C